MNKLKFGVLTILFLLFTSSLFITSIRVYRVEYEIIAQPSHIRDGDTFEIPNYPAIRLADVSCPETNEYGGSEATQALTALILSKTVYIDVDDVYRTGPYGRLICLVYVDWNATHYLNVNTAMVLLNKAIITDYDNEWNPYTWTPYITKTTTKDLARFLGYSAVASFLIALIINWVLSQIWNQLVSFTNSVKEYLANI